MSERIPETDATFIPDPLSDDELDRVSGGAIDRIRTPEEEQMLQVQMSMQRENQVFSSVSNVLKSRDDTSKNSIGN